MIRYLILFLLIASPAYAGIGVCHDGAGNITALEDDANSVAFQGANCVYYSVPATHTANEYNALMTLVKTQGKYLKWDGGPVLMTQGEKNQKDADIAAQAQASDDARFNAMIDQLKSDIDTLDTPEALLNECIGINIIASEIRAIKANNPNPSATDAQLRKAVKNCLESKKR